MRSPVRVLGSLERVLGFAGLVAGREAAASALAPHQAVQIACARVAVLMKGCLQLVRSVKNARVVCDARMRRLLHVGLVTVHACSHFRMRLSRSHRPVARNSASGSANLRTGLTGVRERGMMTFRESVAAQLQRHWLLFLRWPPCFPMQCTSQLEIDSMLTSVRVYVPQGNSALPASACQRIGPLIKGDTCSACCVMLQYS